MSNCKHCGKEIKSKTGRRPRLFCNDTCRNTFHNANKKPKESTKVWKSTYDAVVAERDHYKAIVLGLNPVLERISHNNQPENKEVIIKERETVSEASKKAIYPLTQEESIITPTKEDEIKAHNEEIKKQIADIKAEKIPPHRNTVWGKKSWEKERLDRILELENKLKYS